MSVIQDMRINASTTKEAKKFIDQNLQRVGKVVSVEHSRNSRMSDYKTVIKGTVASITIIVVLSSGYDGEGVKGLISAGEGRNHTCCS